MNYVIPMAGAGSRFVNAGFTLPKPLIPVEGEAMYRWAVASLDLTRCTRLIFVLRRGEYTDQLSHDIASTFAGQDPRILVIDHLTRGQAETVLLTRDLIDYDQPVLVHNSDTAFTSTADAWDFGTDDGVLLTFHSDEARWSYARADATGRVDLVAEKVVISDQASTGTYYFADARDLFDRLERLSSTPVGADELYLAPLYNDMIADGRTVTVRPVRQNLCFGTPLDLSLTEAIVRDQNLKRSALIARAT